mgnify:CR=1 FL=1
MMVSDPIAAVANHLDMPKTCARLVLRLYEAGGRHVHRESLMDEMCTLSRDSLKSTMYRVRKAMGEGIVECGRGNAGRGYWLTPKGLSMVLCALHPPELQESRHV